jgi:hypothetical protein
MPPRLPEVKQTKLRVAHLVDAETEFRNHSQQTEPLEARLHVRFHLSLLSMAPATPHMTQGILTAC